MSHSVYLYQSVSLSPSSQSVLSSSWHSFVIFPSSSLVFHNISVPSVALDIKHLKTFTVTSGEMCCHAGLWLSNTCIFLGLWTYMNPWRTFKIFSTNGVSGVNNFKCVCPGFLCHVCGLISLSLWFFLWLSFSLVVNFSVIFLLLPLDSYLFSYAYHNKFPVSVVPTTSLPERGKQRWLLKRAYLKNLVKDIQSKTSVMPSYLFNLHMMIWWCRPWFGSACTHGPVQSDLA